MLTKYLHVVLATALLVTCAALMGCDKEVPAPVSEEQSTASGDDMPAARFYLPDDKLALEVDHALDGDQEAADRVFMHYATVGQHDQETQLKWLRIAVENGSAGYMEYYAMRLYGEGGYERCRRALFWLKRSSELAPALREGNELHVRAIEQDSACRRSK